LGAVLTPLGEPLSTILVHKLSGPPYNAGFAWPLEHFGLYIVTGVFVISLLGAFWIGRKITIKPPEREEPYTETLRGVIIRALKVFLFVTALILLGEGLKPLIIWYFTKISPMVLYWINTLSAILDNATLTAVEIGPELNQTQIVSAILALLVSGGMLIPGNIPNIVAAGRLRISMKEWAVIGLPMGFIIMVIYFLILMPRYLAL
jgi:predicted cation transporter